ncbi:hypothetical protein T484DRAFT_2324132 [Baffinella frigidus]|nr:hypothetical protein T484DRAFT_2324132 [Cryptophyta sp. CCMP2293]
MQAYLASQDLYALGYAIGETVFTCLASRGEKEEEGAGAAPRPSPVMEAWLKNAAGKDDENDEILGPMSERVKSSPGAPKTDQNALKGMMEDVFSGDIKGAFRDYCAADPQYLLRPYEGFVGPGFRGVT